MPLYGPFYNFSPSEPTWVEGIRPFSTSISYASSLSPRGKIGFLAASRSSDNPHAADMGCIALETITSNDNTAYVQFAWGIYNEITRSAGAGTSHAQENDIINFGTSVATGPYSLTEAGITSSLWLASGGDHPSTTDASVAIAILSNSAKFLKGIVFAANALTGSDGSTGTAIAIDMAKGHTIEWKSSNSQTAFIRSNSTNTTTRTGIVFVNGGVQVTNQGEYPVLSIVNTVSSANYFTLTSTVAGTGPSLSASGSDTDISVRFTPKGAGVVDFVYAGNTASNAANFTATNYIKIKVNGTDAYVPYRTATW